MQMDSLADIVNFGVAPALVLYFMLLNSARPARLDCLSDLRDRLPATGALQRDD
jgi:phosphatidylserine synthase